MTRDQIIRMAREAGFTELEFYGSKAGTNPTECLERFANLVATAVDNKYKWDVHTCGPTCAKVACVRTRKAVEAEREACAQICDRVADDEGEEELATWCAAAIRARGN